MGHCKVTVVIVCVFVGLKAAKYYVCNDVCMNVCTSQKNMLFNQLNEIMVLQ